MKELGRLAGESLLNFLKTEEGRKTAMTATKKAGQALGGLGSAAGRVAEDVVLSGAPAVGSFAAKFADKKGLIGRVAQEVATAPTDRIIDTAIMAGRVAKPVAQGVAVAGTGALVGGLLTKPDTAYSVPMEQLAAREAAEYGIIDAKLQADAERQLGNERLAARKFEQSLYLQEQRQQHEMMMAQARSQARTPMNQPMSGSRLFDPMSIGQGISGGTSQY